MPAYVIFIRERTIDKSELDAYAKLAGPSLEGLPIKFLVRAARGDDRGTSRPDRLSDPCRRLMWVRERMFRRNMT
jgi:hypothetical protein